ncbi:S53 family peptidase [Streptomyces sp. NPDC050619]|uniref:S53 family peptidase n=1 Tax=Streptomyces sp. NPDC050619 TaxID=3157214 RepID=UPI0034332B10
MSEIVDLVLLVRRRRGIPASLVRGLESITRDELADGYGPDPADITLTGKVMERLGLRVASADAASRRVVVKGPLATVAEVFDARITHFEADDPLGGSRVAYRGHGELRLPVELDGVVLSVFGLGTTPRAIPLFRSLAGRPQIVYTPPELGSLYSFPGDTDGSGQTLAVISVTGGWRQRDIDEYFAQLGLQTPAIRTVGIDGTGNAPGPATEAPSPADIEAVLDVQVAGSLAPGAQLVNYFAPNTDSGILNALRTAVHATPAPTAISLSWGSSEKSNSEHFVAAMEDLFMEAAALGITVCAASGDAGSGNDEHDGGSHVNYPASSPHVLAVGGTTLIADPSTDTIHSETAWNTGAGRATGGGVSNLFDLPSWQAQAGVPNRFGTTKKGRGVPDVAANADGMTGYQIFMNGNTGFVGGTSPATPLWAALVCRLAQALGRPLGLLQPLIYQDLVPGNVTPGFRDVAAGDNGAYAAAPGWDPNTGLGSPDGTALLHALQERTLPEHTR